MIEIIAVRLIGGRDHEHIREVQWRSTSTVAGQSSREGLAEWLRASSDNRAFVGDERVDVAAVVGPEGSLYVRSYANGVWRDDLLGLPTF
jgi:hypothetical protein